MLENNQRLDKPKRCPPSVYEVMLRCWSWGYVCLLICFCVCVLGAAGIVSLNVNLSIHVCGNVHICVCECSAQEYSSEVILIRKTIIFS